MAKMTLGQWKATLGDAIQLELAPGKCGIHPMQLVKGINAGKVKLHTFRGSDGRVFRMVKIKDVIAYRDSAGAKPVITMEGMKAAFKEMAES